ncbi:MAG: FG-GAP-like repeat-containing protein, partial [Myxococcota bacterium]
MRWLVAISACRPLPGSVEAPSSAAMARGGGLVLQLEQTLVGPAGTAYGSAFARGDVNGDALSDLVVGGPSSGGGRVDLYLGEAGTLATAPAWSFVGGAGTGSALAGCDVDADGFDEIVVGDPVDQVVRVFPGWPTGPLEPVLLVGAPPNGSFGAAVACGDVDDNEVDDVVVGSPAGGG